ncbi:MAG: GTPase ObgE, partial [Pseudomonadota bacterium]
PAYANPGQEGQERWIWLRLKLIADVGLAGLPNAGKSTFLAAASAARPKIADYPFTTLVPNLGVVDLSPTERFVIADIPGLIEGASEGAGLGTRFLGHVERSGCLIHLIDGTQDDVAGAYHTIRNELEAYGAGLAEKAEVLALNKVDALTPEAREEKAAELEAAAGRRPMLVSGVSGEGVTELLRAAWTEVRKDRGEIAPAETDETVMETPGGWEP